MPEATTSTHSATSSTQVVRLLLLAAAALAAFVILYLLAVQTGLGQRADEAALTGGRSTPDAARDAADQLLRIVSVGSLTAAITVLSGLAILRRRPGLLLIPLAVVGLSLIATEAMKLVVLQRPDLIIDPKLVDNTYPSGHTTVAISLGLAAVLISPTRLRPLVGFAAAGLAAAAGVFVVTADWHRPSDPIGSFLLTLAVAAACAAALRLRKPSRGLNPDTAISAAASARTGAARLEVAALLAGMAVFVAAGVIGSLKYGSEIDWNRLHAAYLFSSAAIVVAAGLTVAALMRALSPEPARAPVAQRRSAPQRHLG